MNWFAYVTRAFSVVGLVTSAIPEIVADGKITVDEIAGLVKQLAVICHWDIEIDVPDELKEQVLGVSKP